MLRKLLLTITCGLFLLTLPTFKVDEVKAKKITVEPPTQVAVVEAKLVDPRTAILRDYLASRDSPLQYHAQDFIDAADTYQIDWRLATAIAGVESTFGKYTPGNSAYPSYNGWGWGVYGNQALYFNSWRNGIFTVSAGLKENYINKGLVTPYQINGSYATSPDWGWKVNFFLNDIDNFAKNYPLADIKFNSKALATKVSGSSAKLTPSPKLALVP